MISKSLSTSRRYARLYPVAGPLAEFCQALYPLLVAHADDFGRQSGDPFTVKHVVCPTSHRSEDDVDHALDALAAVGLVVRYDSNGEPALEIVQFKDHQPGLKQRGGQSRFVPSAAGTCREVPGTAGTCREVPSELNRTELNRTEQKKDGSAEPLRDSPPAPPEILLTFPTVGTDRTWDLTRTRVDEWAQAYPNVDVLGECRKALAWIQAKPERRKTARGMSAFLVNWLNRSVDHRRVVPIATAATGTSGRGRTGVTPGEFDGFEERD